ncbi:dTDP-4-dehydrorhamnose reductase [Desulfobaculum xiamenense]|uniref:dTDP-4-dehydrorhamnose reductase n=1 Tax=Desulfobaculum xiamenense TaxID=995050 RepID=A0A846QSV3_9BACT|nr:dTDP-4-dehydrorhamnose reductase [Desulfobaculum xiamenense]NJB69443.1 dTDP-4-dehydrorhamnose reductase [Desulfobaculum xiamenense]
MSEGDSRKALVFGGRSGLLGMTLARTLENAGWTVSVTGRPEEWAYDVESLRAFIASEAPDAVFNTWAYTQVDLAEDEPNEARRVNAVLPGIIGRAMRDMSAALVHYSTDFVFDGKKGAPYTEDDATAPQSAYGRTKLEGETALTAAGLARLIIIRTAWLFGPGKKNFVHTMLNLCATRDSLGVVHDQVGSPTYTPDLAAYSLALLESGASGIFHVVNSGRASWCELACEAVRSAGLPCTMTPIASAEYPQKATRPAFSVLDTSRFTAATGITPRPWLQAVQEYVYRETADDTADE